MRLIKIIALLIFCYGIFYIFFDFAFVDANTYSMVPTLYPRDRFLYFRYAKPAINGIFLIDDPRNPNRKLVKRISYFIPPNLYFVSGDNKNDYWGPDIGEISRSLDSGGLGLVHESFIHERVVFVFWPPRNVGLVW